MSEVFTQMVNVNVQVALPTIRRMEGEGYRDYQNRVHETAVRLVRESVVTDNRLHVLEVK